MRGLVGLHDERVLAKHRVAVRQPGSFVAAIDLLGGVQVPFYGSAAAGDCLSSGDRAALVAKAVGTARAEVDRLELPFSSLTAISEVGF